MQILNGQFLTIPLYHGTSTLFLDGILRKGLGGWNLVSELRIIDMLTQVYETCITETDFKKEDPIADMVCNKILVHENDAWKYDGIFLSTSKYRAFNHATLNKYGSELISVAMYLYEYITKHNTNYHFTNKVHNELVNYFQKEEPKPVVIRVDNMDINKLFFEGHGDKDIKHKLSRFQESYTNLGESYGEMFRIDFSLPYGSSIDMNDVTIYKDIKDIRELEDIKVSMI